MKQIVAIVMTGLVCLLAAGCGAPSSGPSLSDKDWAQGKGALAAQIGNMDEPQVIVNRLYDGNEELWNEYGYGAPTGQWFLYNGNGKLGYGIPSGTKRAGESVSVSLSSPIGEVKVDRNVRVQLVEWGNSQEGLLIEEQIVHVDTVNENQDIVTIALPATENTAYIISAEVLDDAGAVEDTLVSQLYVPRPEINAQLRTDQSSYNSSVSTINLNIANAGPTFLFMGKEYSIEKKVGSIWRIVPLELAFEDIGLHLPPGEEYLLNVDIGPLDPGQYRIVKQIRAEGTELIADLATEFAIE